MRDARRAIAAFFGLVAGIPLAFMILIATKTSASPWHDGYFILCVVALCVVLSLAVAAEWSDFIEWLSASVRRLGRRRRRFTSNLDPRNAAYTGREPLLLSIRRQLQSGNRIVVLHGMSGVGKTQLALEYAWRYKNTYNIIWWVQSEEPGVIAEKFADLAVRLNCVTQDASYSDVSNIALGELSNRTRWLLIFDDAATAAEVTPWLPVGTAGQILITSQRRSGWQGITAAAIHVGVFTRQDSIAVLRGSIGGLTADDAEALAEGLGDLPLAIAQATSYLTDSEMSASIYLREVDARAAVMLGQGTASSYPHTLTAAVQLSMEKLRASDPAAADLAEIAAFFAPDPIPVELFRVAAKRGRLREPLASTADDVAWGNTVAALNRSAVARVEAKMILMHRLVQAILRDVSIDSLAARRELAIDILAVARPDDPSQPDNWPQWAQLIPHILKVDPAASFNSSAYDLTCQAILYLLMHGDWRTAHSMADRARDLWESTLGPNDSYALKAASYVARALALQGRFHEARDIEKEILRRRRALDSSNPETLASASDLANYLRECDDPRAAQELDEQTLHERRRILGEYHRDTLRSAIARASDLAYQHKWQTAFELDTQTREACQRCFGDDDLDTLRVSSNLAADLGSLDRLAEARELDEDILRRRRRVQGEDHPDVLRTESNLFITLGLLGKKQEAVRSGRDILLRSRRVLGPDHPQTLSTAGSLANALNESHRRRHKREAVRLAEDTLRRLRTGEPGWDDPNTIALASDLVGYYRDAGNRTAAEELEADTQARVRKVLGPGHPGTLRDDADLAAYRQAWTSSGA
jgi:Tetratricopeptide repeat